MRRGVWLCAVLLVCASMAWANAARADVPVDAAHFPDARFRQWVKENIAEGKDVLTDAQIAEVDELLVFEEQITDLKGLEYFTALKTLGCADNQLKVLDLSRNTALEDVACFNNALTTLDVSKNTALRKLSCQGNPIKALNLSANKELGEVNPPEAATLILPNGFTLDMRDIRVEKRAEGGYRLDLARFSDRIGDVGVVHPRYSEYVEESTGVYTFAANAAQIRITWNLSDEAALDLLLDVPGAITSEAE